MPTSVSTPLFRPGRKTASSRCGSIESSRPCSESTVSNPAGGYSTLDERSDGLKIFVSLLALTATQQSEVPPIVLIDELERHLHYDAQADVVQVMSTQTVIPQIIYTTHSAGCLPEDIGAGVRLVGTNDGANRSTVENRFWSTGPGFSPLLIGMGASSLAFRPGPKCRAVRGSNRGRAAADSRA